MKKLLIVIAAVLFATPSFADDLDQYLQLLKTDVRANAKEIVKKGMITFTDEEATRFWPIWDSYVAEREKFLDARVALILGITVLVALAIYYFVGVDEGAVSAFGKTMVIHEWVHDSRHFLGFPCH